MRAGRQALDAAGLDPRDIDLIILGTDSPDYITPATSVVVQHKLGAHNAGTYDVGCACASFPTAIAAAAGQLVTNNWMKYVLVISAYMMSKLAADDDVTRFYYGDGAGRSDGYRQQTWIHSCLLQRRRLIHRNRASTPALLSLLRASLCRQDERR